MSHPELNGHPEQNGQVDEMMGLAHLSDLFRLDLGIEADGSPEDSVDATEGMPVHLIPPPDAVWAKIAAATGAQVQASSEAVRRTADTVMVAELAPELTGGSDLFVVRKLAVVKEFRSAPPARSGRAEPLITFLAAASLVVGLLGGAGAVFGLQRWGDDGSSAPAVSVLSRATLTALPGAPAAAGDVDMVQTATGRQLQVSVRRLAAPDGFYEVWLANTSLTKMVPVGLMQGDTATFDLPADVDPAGFSTVDISLEPMDGDPAHSSHSVLRGTLGTA